jgi:3-dehydro-L-gulonate 2-dehydrogenase
MHFRHVRVIDDDPDRSCATAPLRHHGIMLRVSYDELFRSLRSVLRDHGFSEDRAELCARLFAESSLDGVASHGLNRFPHFLETIGKGYVKPDAEPIAVARLGGLEQWDGRLGPGNLNAHGMMNRAIELSRSHGIGCVALRNTNHWMRGGSYGWQAADAGVAAICWTNTMPNLPPWGAKESRLGNNPLVMAVPRREGHVVLDMAMSQFSYGKLAAYRSRGESLPVPGGYDRQGEITRDPGEIEASWRPLPIGFWKGAGLSFVLDAMAALLSGGDAVLQIGERGDEYGISQVFIALELERLHPSAGETARRLEDMIAYTCGALPASGEEMASYPGQRTLRARTENLSLGIPVDRAIWHQLLDLREGRGSKAATSQDPPTT